MLILPTLYSFIKFQVLDLEKFSDTVPIAWLNDVGYGIKHKAN